MLIGILCGAVNGLFGAGGGVISVLAMTKLLKTDKKTAHSTTVAVILVLSCVSIFFYAKSGAVLWKDAVRCAVGGIGGGCLGAYFLKKLSPVYVSRIFGALMLLSAWRLLC